MTMQVQKPEKRVETVADSTRQHSTEGLMDLVQTYANQEVQCVARSEDEAYWGLFRERERIGDGIRAYLEAMVQNAYAEGRKDEREQWESVARQALGALNTCDGCDSYKGYSQWFAQEQVENAIKALCALICPVCLGAGWVEDKPGEQCSCGLHSWEARK